jgi:hypothetical protein
MSQNSQSTDEGIINNTNRKKPKPTTPTNPTKAPNVVTSLLIDKVFSVLSITAKTSSKIVGPSILSLASTLVQHYQETLLTPTSKHRLKDWTHVGKAWYKTLTLLSQSYSSKRPDRIDHSLENDVHNLLESLSDFITCDNTRSCMSESFRLFLRFLDILRSDETKAAMAHVPIVYTHFVDALASGQAKQLVHTFMEQLLPHFIDWVTNEQAIESLAHILAYTLHALEMERIHRKVTYQASSRKIIFSRTRRKTRVQALVHDLTFPKHTKSRSYLHPVQRRAQRRYERNQFIRTSVNSYSQIILDEDEENHDGDEEEEENYLNANIVANNPETSTTSHVQHYDDHVSSLGEKTSSTIELDWVNQLGKDHQHNNALDSHEDSNGLEACPPSKVITIPNQKSEEIDPAQSHIQLTVVKEIDKSNKNSSRVDEDLSDMESCKIDSNHDREDAFSDDYKDVLLATSGLKSAHAPSSKSVLSVFNKTLEDVQGEAKRSMIDQLLSEERSIDESKGSVYKRKTTATARIKHGRNNHQRPSSWFPKSAAAAGCGDEYGHDTLKKLMSTTMSHQHPRIFRRDDDMYERKKFQHLLVKNDEEHSSIITALWDMLSSRQKVIMYILVANIVIFLILTLLLGSYFTFLILAKILR